ncbi:MAG: transcriptional regulator, partial [Thermoproteota archaeon]
MFDKFKKEEEGEMTEERTVDEHANMKSRGISSNETVGEIGIVELMDKRAKLEEAIDYVGLMIKNLKDKRTVLEKDIEEESVDIKNL